MANDQISSEDIVDSEHYQISQTSKRSKGIIRSTINRFNSLNLRFRLLFVIFLSLFLIATNLNIRYKNATKIQYGKWSPNVLAVISSLPRGEVLSLSPEISIEFNDKVEAHHIEEFFSISPSIDGQLKQGKSEREIIFVPDRKLQSGAYYQVRLEAGAPSENGLKLRQKYIYSFSIARDINTIQFVNDEWAGKFMSFDVERGAEIKLKVGSEVENPSLKIFKADTETLLNSLTYKGIESELVYPKSGTYYDLPVDTSKLHLLEDFPTIQNDQDLNFKSDLGIYYIQSYESSVPLTNVWVVLNKSGLHLRQDDKNIYFAAQNLATGQPIDGNALTLIDVTLYELKDKPREIAKHTLSGIQQYSLPISERLDLVIGKLGNDIMVIPVSLPNSQSEILRYNDLSKTYRIFIHTDRPVYKKGAVVSFRGVVRRDEDGLYQKPDIDSVRVFSWVGGSKEKIEQTVEVDSDGIFSGNFTLPDEVKGESFGLYATTKFDDYRNEIEGSVYFDVFEYNKPAYDLDVTLDKPEYINGDKIKVYLKGSLFAGGPLANEKVYYSVFTKDYFETEKQVYNSAFNLNSWGGMCGVGSFDEYYGQELTKLKELNFDSEGRAYMEFDTSELDKINSQELTFLIEKTDSFGNKLIGARNAIVHQGEYNIFMRNSYENIMENKSFSTVFNSETLTGEKLANKEFNYELYTETWKDGKPSAKNVIKSGTTLTDENGIGIIDETLSDSEDIYNLYMEVFGTDGRNNRISTRKSLYVITSADRYYRGSSNTPTILKIISKKNSLVVGDKATLEIESPSDMTVFATFERGRVYTPHWIYLKKGKNTYEYNVLSSYSPSISPTFSFFYEGKYHIEGLSLNVPAMHKLIDVEISKDKEEYDVGDTAIITVTTRDNQGNLISADLGVGIVDKAIYAIKKGAILPFHSTLYYFRPRSTNSSSSLSWIATFNWEGGGGGGGGGSSTYFKDSDTLYWNPRLKTGSDGQVKIEVPVGSTLTTWKVLSYASTDDTKVGQGELDFLVKE